MIIDIVDTTFSRANMGAFVVDKLKRHTSTCIIRVTVPGLKNIPVAAKKLIEEEWGDIIMTQLMTNKHIIEVFVHKDEAKDDVELVWMLEQRMREHVINVVPMLTRPQDMTKFSGTCQHQGFADSGPARP
jgi:riboflavin synthase